MAKTSPGREIDSTAKPEAAKTAEKGPSFGLVEDFNARAREAAEDLARGIREDESRIRAELEQMGKGEPQSFLPIDWKAIEDIMARLKQLEQEYAAAMADNSAVKSSKATAGKPLEIEDRSHRQAEQALVAAPEKMAQPKAEPLQIEYKPESSGELVVSEQPAQEAKRIEFDPAKHEMEAVEEAAEEEEPLRLEHDKTKHEIAAQEKKPGRKKAVIVDISEVVKAMAWREAEQKLRHMLDKSNSNFLKRAAIRLGEKGYLMRYYKEALAAISGNQNLMAEIEARFLSASEVKSENKGSSYEILDAVLEEFTREVADADEKGDLVQDEEVDLSVGQLFADYATSAMTREEFDRAVRDRVVAQLRAKGKKFATAEREAEAEGLMYANNLFAMAEGYRKQIEERKKELGEEFGPEQLANIEAEIKAEMALDIQLGLKQKDLYETKPKPVLKWYDKFVDMTENVPILNKVIANPVTYGVVGGIAGAVAGKGAARLAAVTGLVAVAGIAPYLAPLLAGAGLGGTFAALRRSRDLQYDRGMDLRRSTLGIQVENDASRTQKIREFNYDVRRAEECLDKLADMMGKDSLTEDDRRDIADIMARVELEKEKSVDLIGVFTAEGEKHKTKLVAMKDLKIALKDLQEKFSLPPDDPELRKLIDAAEADLIQDIENNDANFDSFRHRQMVKSGLMGASLGIVAGAVGQWAAGEFSEHVLGRAPKAESALEHLYHYMRGDAGTPAGGLEHLSLADGQLVDKDGHAVVEGLSPDPETGRIDPSKLAELRQAGVVVNETHSQVTENASVAGTLKEGLAKHARADWHDEPGKKMSSFFNRLIEHEGKQQMFYLDKDASGGVTVDASKILENLSANAKDAVKEFGTNPDGSVDTKLAGLRDQLEQWASRGELAKHLKVAIFPTEGDNKAGLSYLTESADESGKINLGDSISKLFGAKDSLKDGNIPFRFGELRIIDNEGNSHVLATITGKDIDPGVMAQSVTEKFGYSFDLKAPAPDANWDVPPVLPFDPRRPLEGPRRNSEENDNGGGSETGSGTPALEDMRADKNVPALEDMRKAGQVPDNLPVVDRDMKEIVSGSEARNSAEISAETDEDEEDENENVRRQTLEELIAEIPLNRGPLPLASKNKAREWLNGLTAEEIDSMRPDKDKISRFNKLVELSFFKEGTVSREFQDDEARTAYGKFEQKFSRPASREVLKPGEDQASAGTV